MNNEHLPDWDATSKEVLRDQRAAYDAMRRRAGAGPDTDLTTSLMHEKVWGRPLSNEEVASILRNWTAGEIGTISAAAVILAHYLAVHADVQAQLRVNPDRLPAAIDEILRMHGPLGDSVERSSRRDMLKIARRFNAGNKKPVRAVPMGRLNHRAADSSRSLPCQSPLRGPSSCLRLTRH